MQINVGFIDLILLKYQISMKLLESNSGIKL